ncbi:MAG TPA: cupin domain-containing protein [candidate division Zixibacteria bacterium]|nr:cupin domain-containing protein [candidate division Zixibacteria bacterium]
MKPDILFTDESAEFYTEERCYILELSNTAEDEAVSIARARVLPGVTTRWHVVQHDERYVIQSGNGRVEVGELAPTEVKPGDVVRIPCNVRQRIANTGADDLVFLAICTPRFRPENYVDVEEE